MSVAELESVTVLPVCSSPPVSSTLPEAVTASARTSPSSTLAFLPGGGFVKVFWIVDLKTIVACVLPRLVVAQFGVATPPSGMQPPSTCPSAIPRASNSAETSNVSIEVPSPLTTTE